MSSRNNEAVYSNQTYLASSGRTVDKDHVFTSKQRDEKIRASAAPGAMSDWERRRYQQMKQRKRGSTAQRPNHQTEKSKGLRGTPLQSIDLNSPKKPSKISPKRNINKSKIVVHNNQIEVTPIKALKGDRVIRSEPNPSKDRVPSFKPPKGLDNSTIHSTNNIQATSIQTVEHKDTTKTANIDITRYDAKQEGQRGVMNDRYQTKSKMGTSSIKNDGLDENYQEFFDYLKKEVSSNNGDLWDSFQIAAGYDANEVVPFSKSNTNVDSKRMKKILGKMHHHLKSSTLFCKASQIQDSTQTKKEHKVNEHANKTTPMENEDEKEPMRRTSKRKEGQKAWTLRALPDITGKTPMKEVSTILPPLPKPNVQPPLEHVMEKSNETENILHSETNDLVQVRDESTITPDRQETARLQPFHEQDSTLNASNIRAKNASLTQNTCNKSDEWEEAGVVKKNHLSPVRVSPFRSRTVMMEYSDYEEEYEQQHEVVHGPSQTVPINHRNESFVKDPSPLVILRPTPKPPVDENTAPTEIPWKVKLRPVSKGVECDLSNTPKKPESSISIHLRPTNLHRQSVINTDLRAETDAMSLGEVIDLKNLPKREFPDSNAVQMFSITNNSNNRNQIVLLNNLIILVASKRQNSRSLANIIWHTKHSTIASLKQTSSSEVTITNNDGSVFPLLFETPQQTVVFLESWNQINNGKVEIEEFETNRKRDTDTDHSENDCKSLVTVAPNTEVNVLATNDHEDIADSAVHSTNIEERNATIHGDISDTVDQNASIKEQNSIVNENTAASVHMKKDSTDQLKDMVENRKNEAATAFTKHLVCDNAHDSGSSTSDTIENNLTSISCKKGEESNTIVYKLSETEYEYVMLLRKMEENGMSREAILHRLDTENATDEIRNIVMDRHVQVQRSPKVQESNLNDRSSATTNISDSYQNEEGDVKSKLDNMFAQKTSPAEEIDSHVNKYKLMLKRGLHEDQVKHAMRRDGMKESIFDQVFCNATSQEEPSSQDLPCVPSPSGSLSVEEAKIASKYKMMLKIGLLEDQVRHKMALDNIDERIVRDVCGPEKMKSPQNKNKLSSNEEEIAAEYLKMLKYGLHEDQVRHKMTIDNIDRKIIDFVCRTTAKKITPKRKRDSNLIRLHVETISNPNPNSVWSTAKKRKQADDQVLNIFMLEDLFKKKPMLPKLPTKAVENKISVGLSGKTMQNVGVVLQKFKDFSTDELIGVIRDLDSKGQIKEENIELMTGLVPTDENDKMLLSNYTGEIDKLSNIEIFLLKLSSIPRADDKIKSIKLMATFKQNCNNLSSRFEVLRCACYDVMKSDRLRDIMIIARDIGNKMNEGNYSGGAEGIKFSSLLKLSETKGNDGKTTVLDFIVARMIENGKQYTLNLVEDFPLCMEASRIFITDLVSEKSALESARKVCKTEELKKRKEESDSGRPYTKGLIKLGKFIKDTETDIEELEACRNKTKIACTELVKFLCEDGDERAATQLLLTLKEFISHIERAVTKYHTLKAKTRPKAKKEKPLNSSLVLNRKETPMSAHSPIVVNQNPDSCTSSRNQTVDSRDRTPVLRPKSLFSSMTPHIEQRDSCLEDSNIKTDTNPKCKGVDPRSALLQSIAARRQGTESDDVQIKDNSDHSEQVKEMPPVVDPRSALLQSIVSRRQGTESDDVQIKDNSDHSEKVKEKPPVVDPRSALLQSIVARRQDTESDDVQIKDNTDHSEQIKEMPPVLDARSALLQSIAARRQDTESDDVQIKDNTDHSEQVKEMPPVVDPRSALLQSIVARRQDTESDDAQDKENTDHSEQVKEMPPVLDARSALLQSIVARRKD